MDWLIVGLGNVGADYTNTRHNAGFWFVDAVCRQYGGAFSLRSKLSATVARITVGNVDCCLIKPDTYMNHSGFAVQKTMRFHRVPPERVLVAHDELDLPSGTARLKCGGGHAGHNGLRHIHAQTATDTYCRVRIGIGRPSFHMPVDRYVLSKPTESEYAAIQSACDKALDVLPLFISGNQESAMQTLHTRSTHA